MNQIDYLVDFSRLENQINNKLHGMLDDLTDTVKREHLIELAISTFQEKNIRLAEKYQCEPLYSNFPVIWRMLTYRTCIPFRHQLI